MRFQHINNCAKIIKTIHIFDIFLKYRKKNNKKQQALLRSKSVMYIEFLCTYVKKFKKCIATIYFNF